ncbi:MAG TPA: hypothetical protein VH540_25275 [Ktedonobacterales bacterium]|jgi:hypothetical protein
MADNSSVTLSLITITLSGTITIGGAVFNYYLNRRAKEKDEAAKRREEAEKLVQRYAKPLVLAASELHDRVESVLNEERLGRLALWPDWKPAPDQAQTTHDYYLKSTLYLIGQFFAWVDIMKKEEIFLPLSDKEINLAFQSILDGCVKAFSDSRIARGPAIFKHQQRAIGEKMSEETGKEKALRCISYSSFVEKYEQDEQYRRWFAPVEALITQLEREGDPRMQRLEALDHQLERFTRFVTQKMGIQTTESGHGKAAAAAAAKAAGG